MQGECMIDGMTSSMKRRAYDSSSRRRSAEATREQILNAARETFLAKGYAATTMPAIAEAAGVAMDTVYAAVGKKPALFRLLVELAISGGDKPVPAEERGYVQAIRAEADAAGKLRLYAKALRGIQPRLAPLIRVLKGAAGLDAELDALWKGIAERRAGNMRLLAKELAETGRVRRELSMEKTADILWSMNSPEYYLLLVEERRWTPEDFEQWLADAWIRLLLEP
jgi:AcrR family transcriptional regulator